MKPLFNHECLAQIDRAVDLCCKAYPSGWDSRDEAVARWAAALMLAALQDANLLAKAPESS